MTIISRRPSRRRSAGILTGIALAFALLVAALPATAGAATLYNEGIPAEEGTTVTLTSPNSVILWQSPEGAITVKCERFEIHGIVTTNTGGEVLIEEGEEASVMTGCTANGAATSFVPKLGRIELSGETGTAPFTFQAGGLSEAVYTTVSWVGPNAREVHLAGPVVGTLPGTFSGDFSLTTGKEEEPLTLT